MDISGRDAAFAQNIGDFGGVVGGYFGGPNAFNIWRTTDWGLFRQNPKLPIWVCGYDGEKEASQAIQMLKVLGAFNCLIGADMESRVDESYLLAFGTGLQGAGYKVLPYGSKSTVFRNPQLNGYWVADWTGTSHIAINPQTGDSLGVRGTQWTHDIPPGYDISTWKEWDIANMWR
jgi:hypothetical protein